MAGAGVFRDPGPFRTVRTTLSFLGQTTRTKSNLSPKRDCNTEKIFRAVVVSAVNGRRLSKTYANGTAKFQ